MASLRSIPLRTSTGGGRPLRSADPVRLRTAGVGLSIGSASRSHPQSEQTDWAVTGSRRKAAPIKRDTVIHPRAQRLTCSECGCEDISGARLADEDGTLDVYCTQCDDWKRGECQEVAHHD